MEVFVTLRNMKMQRILIRKSCGFVSVLIFVLALLSTSYANAAEDNDIVDMIMPVISAVSAPPPSVPSPPPKRPPPPKYKTCYCNGFPMGMCRSDTDCVGRCAPGAFRSCY